MPSALLWHKESSSVNKITRLKKYFEVRNRIIIERRMHLSVLKFVSFFLMQISWWLITGKTTIKVLGAVVDGISEKANPSIMRLVNSK